MIPYKFNPLGISRDRGDFYTYLKFTAAQANSSIKLTTVGSPNVSGLKYKKNDGLWTNYIIDTIIDLLNIGDSVQFLNTSDTLSLDYNNYANFVMYGKIKGSGNCQSLLNFSKIASSYCFTHLFDYCSALISAPQLLATILEACCYDSMFWSCTSLTTAPLLPITSLAPHCYQFMFQGCTSLVSPPQLPATTLTPYCYYNMFNGCNNLNELDVNLTNFNNSNNSTTNWLNNVAVSGNFYCLSNLTIPSRDENGVPSGWNIIPKDVTLGKIIEENGVKKFGVLSFDGTSSTIDTIESFDNVYSFNTISGQIYNRKLEYIESTGTQYINTGVNPDFANGDSIEIHYYGPSFSGASPCIFGSRESGVLNGVYFLGSGPIIADSEGYSTLSVKSLIGEHIISINDTTITVDESSYTMPRHVTCGLPIFLFALNNYGTGAYGIYSGMRLYDWKYYHNGVLTQHFIPVIDNNNVPCLFDTVSNTFIYNAGTGTFNYEDVLSEDVIGLGQIIDENGIQKFESFEFNGTIPRPKEIKTYANVYKYNK